MRKVLFTFLSLISFYSYAQKKPPRFVVEAKADAFHPVGNSYLKDGIKPFYGLGFATEIIFLRNFGLGYEFSYSFSSVKNQAVYGTLKDLKMSSYSFYALYMYSVAKNFELEGMLGYTSMSTKSTADNGWELNDYREGGEGVFLGGKFLYTVVKEPHIQLFISPKVQFYRANEDYFADNSLNDYYTKATFLHTNAGIRFNF